MMKKTISLLLILFIALSGCSKNNEQSQRNNDDYGEIVDFDDPDYNKADSYNNLDDENLTRYVKDTIYAEIVKSPNFDDIVVQNVDAVYISKEYVEELSYNSKENVFFGYNLSDLNKKFEGKKYIFTLGEDGKTTVQEFEGYESNFDEVIKNVAIGSGVILVCVTVSVVSAGVGAPAISMIFAASAKTGALMATSSAVMGGISSEIISYAKNGEVDVALDEALLGASEGFKCGAIIGAISGGGIEAIGLHKATSAGLSMNQAAIIQKESGYPLEVISQIHSMEEYQIYKDAGLTATKVNGKLALVQNIDLNYISELPDGTKVTNLERMLKGYAPLDASGNAYQLHHVYQEKDGVLAILTNEQHQNNSAILNIIEKEGVHNSETGLSNAAWSRIRAAFWKSYAGGLK